MNLPGDRILAQLRLVPTLSLRLVDHGPKALIQSRTPLEYALNPKCCPFNDNDGKLYFGLDEFNPKSP